MRFVRSLAFFFLGFALAGFSVASFASAASWGRSTNLNYPGVSGGARAPGWYGSPIYDFPDAPGGAGHFRDINRVGVGGRIFDVDSRRIFSPGNLAKAGRAMAKVYGPLALGLTLADLIWDPATQQFLDPTGGPYDPVQTCLGYTSLPNWQSAYYASCNGGGATPPAFWKRTDGAPHLVYGIVPNSMKDQLVSQGWSWGNNCGSKHVITKACAANIPKSPIPATDQQIEDAIYVELVARGMGSDLARRLIEAGYRPDVSEITTTGPSSIPGSTTTSTTSGPSGTTTTTRETSYDMDYAPGSVTIKERTTETTTAPDGTSTTTTTESTPPATGGTSQPAPPEEPPKPFCELYPDASACQNLDVPTVTPTPPETIDVIFVPSGGFGSGGSCPAPYAFNVQGRAFAIDYQPLCNFMIALNPVVIAVAFVTALLIALGGYKRD
ncbi:virulence factor TspB C-terminal domain-related protein [Parazoarcus communis]|uniref:TspB protein n=1 Tax=Parazoarcus communis SWub3 = DSM 12120 TaxID=1121029 RepID=A0A323URV6_9RHOO|nr:virulence factor TspB C-terminal domain-related protein [Parazoarcus communis]NMG72537.1 hypothetical protein [Parazoarcus communis SWub3 = DSM 12120]PZA14971.1 hypothetical protein DNK49_19205 [Azoarcus communis] [Parazoarcus communis SWub3 = DSM 12120]